MLLIVMYEAQTWRVRPGEPFTFGRAPDSSAVLPAADRGVSRSAGSFRFHDRWWWLHNDSASCVLCVLGDRGFRADLPPGLQVPLQQWHAKVTVNGTLGNYTLRLRLPDLDDVPDPGQRPPVTGEMLVTGSRNRPRLTDDDRLVLAARFEDYLTWRHAGEARRRAAPGTPRSGSAGSPTRFPSGARTSGTGTCAWASPGCAGRGPWTSWRGCWSPPVS